MEHFEIVLALCRSGLQTQNPAVANHVRRLARALQKSGPEEEARLLASLERNDEITEEIQPSRVVLSLAMGEPLTRSVKPPVDRETSAPLAQIVHPDDGKQPQPIFNPELSSSILNLLEEWQNAAKLKQMDVRPVMSLMLFGAPGTGKTMLAHSIASNLGLPLVIGKLDGLVSSFLGTTARNISNLFAFANRYQCVLLLDEFDALAKLRDDPNELGELKRVVNTLLQCLDARAEIGFTIAITNHQSLLDPAVWRRFDVRIEVPNPDHLTRLKIIGDNFEGAIKLSDTEIQFLSWLTTGHSGADIRRLADFIKRHIAIKGPHNVNFLELVRKYVQLSALDTESKNRLVALESSEEIAYALSTDPDAPMQQEQLAELFGKGQATISRWLRDRRSQRGKHAK